MLTPEQRRATVYDPYNPEYDPDLHTRVVFPKSDARRAWLRDTMSSIFFLADLHPDAKEEMVDAFEFRDFQRGERVIAQGDDGDYVYLVFAGTLDAYIQKDNEQEPRLVKTYKGDGFFGELALLYNQKRAATIIARTDCTLAALVCLFLVLCLDLRQTHKLFLLFNFRTCCTQEFCLLR